MPMKEYSSDMLVAEGITFGEGPRWHGGKLWFSDMHANRVLTVDSNGRLEPVVTGTNRPSGLGFDTQGRLLVVSMHDRRLLRLVNGALETVADMSALMPGDANDMVVDGNGRAFIGNFGFDLFAGGEPKTTCLVAVDPDGRARVVADELSFPNGSVITPDGKTLIVAETFAGTLTAFNIKADGSLSGRRFFAHLGDRQPDGICLDADGAVWASCFGQDEFIRVWEGGDVAARIAVPGRRAVACMLGGEDRRTLFMLTAETSVEELAQGKSRGHIETARVDVPGAGYP
jgi:sugar lactone lactonase YvrE